jgi:phage terminase large subunit-like protein
VTAQDAEPGIELPDGWQDWTEADKLAFAHRLQFDWTLWARPEQLPPPGEWWSIWAYIAGRGSGKTRTGAEWVRGEANEAPGRRIAAIGPTAGDVRETIFEGVSGLLSVFPDDELDDYNRSTHKIRLTNGSEIRGFSGETPDRLRGPQHHAAWVDELAAMPYADDVWAQMRFGLRLGSRPRTFISTTPRPTPLLRGILGRDDCVISRGRTWDNVANLSEQAVRDLFDTYEGTWLGAQELEGELIDEAPGALFTLAVLEGSRVQRKDLPRLVKKVVVVDPAVSTGPKSDETGIALIGLGEDGDVYVLADLSLRAPPNEWARVAVRCYQDEDADLILYEKNQGGLLVLDVLKTVDPYVKSHAVNASASKAARAQPVVALFEQKRAHLVGVHPKLEQQMTGWEPGISRFSPDRLDAVVHGVVFLRPRPPARLITPTQAARALRLGPRRFARR